MNAHSKVVHDHTQPHVSDIHHRTIDRHDVYGLFVAPTIDLNTAETFRVGTWYRQGRKTRLNIVSLTLPTYIRLITSLLTQRRPPADLRTLLDTCLAARETDAPDWLRTIETTVTTWTNTPAPTLV